MGAATRHSANTGSCGVLAWPTSWDPHTPLTEGSDELYQTKYVQHVQIYHPNLWLNGKYAEGIYLV